jgi:hypothetical protein
MGYEIEIQFLSGQHGEYLRSGIANALYLSLNFMMSARDLMFVPSRYFVKLGMFLCLNSQTDITIRIL